MRACPTVTRRMDHGTMRASPRVTKAVVPEEVRRLTQIARWQTPSESYTVARDDDGVATWWEPSVAPCTPDEPRQQWLPQEGWWPPCGGYVYGIDRTQPELSQYDPQPNIRGLGHDRACFYGLRASECNPSWSPSGFQCLCDPGETDWSNCVPGHIEGTAVGAGTTANPHGFVDEESCGWCGVPLLDSFQCTICPLQLCSSCTHTCWEENCSGMFCLLHSGQAAHNCPVDRSTRTKCASSRCNYITTWYDMFCCKNCEKSDGKHGKKCDHKPMPIEKRENDDSSHCRLDKEWEGRACPASYGSFVCRDSSGATASLAMSESVAADPIRLVRHGDTVQLHDGELTSLPCPASTIRQLCVFAHPSSTSECIKDQWRLMSLELLLAGHRDRAVHIHQDDDDETVLFVPVLSTATDCRAVRIVSSR